MKTKLISILFYFTFFFGTSLLAQFSFKDLLTRFNKNLFMTDVTNTKIMYKDGRIVDNVKTFYHPVIISSPTLNLGEWSIIIDKEGYAEKSISKKNLKAIYIDGNTWVLRSDPSQGDS
jgi:phenylpropionate dioxygenase-like ring-hydroxylating dioxygenase large terminal subunit